MTFRVALTIAALFAALASTAAAEFYGDGTFYGNNQWAGACAGNVPWAGKPWPPPGSSYITSMSPGNPTPFNVALNSAQYSTAQCGKLLWVKATGQNAGCTTCGTTPIPAQYMLARVTNECPECLFGSLDFGMNGDGRWKIQWHWADAGTSTYSTGSVARAVVPVRAAPRKAVPKPAPKVHHHTAAYWAKLWAIKKRHEIAAKAAKGRKLLLA